jgi:hypothetical protein
MRMADEARRAAQDREAERRAREQREHRAAEAAAAYEATQLRRAAETRAASLRVNRSGAGKTRPPAPLPPFRDGAPPDPAAAARRAAFEAGARAAPEADLAYKLNAAGLLTRAQLDRSIRERDAAREAVEEALGPSAIIERAIREAVVPKRRPAKPKARPMRGVAFKKGARSGPSR